jgi:site-specific recombinase XerD
MARPILPVFRDSVTKFSVFAAGYVKYLRTHRGVSERTCENYELAYGQLRAYLHGQGLPDEVKTFNADVCEAFAQYLTNGGNKPSSVNTKLAALSSLARYGMRTKSEGRDKYVMSDNPVERIERPKRQKPRERYLYRDEIRAMLGVEAPANERLALAFLFETQLRASAAVNANVRDLSFDGERLVLSVTEKGGNPDTFILDPALAEPLLESLKLRQAEPDEALLVNLHGHRYTRTHLSDMVLRLARKAGITRIPVRAHVFARHSPASLAGQDGASVFEIAAMLRHRNANTANRYVHGVTGDAARARVRALVSEAGH